MEGRQFLLLNLLEGIQTLEKEMATHSNILAWRIPWTEDPGRLQSVGSPKSQTQLSDQTTIQTLSNFSQLPVLLTDF